MPSSNLQSDWGEKTDLSDIVRNNPGAVDLSGVLQQGPSSSELGERVIELIPASIRMGSFSAAVDMPSICFLPVLAFVVLVIEPWAFAVTMCSAICCVLC